MADYALQHQFLLIVTFHGFDGVTTKTVTFAGSDGGDSTSEISAPIRPGGMLNGVKLAGLTDTEDVTVTKPFDRVLDPPLREWLKANRGCTADGLKKPLGPNKLPVGTGEKLDCILGTVSAIAVDANSNDAASWGVTLGVQE